MAKILQKEKVRELRKQGLSYSQIRERVSVSRSTLSRWLEDMPLSKGRINELQAKSPQRIEKFRATMKRKKDIRFQGVFDQEKHKVAQLSKRELYLLGLGLYWAEGTKVWNCKTEITNSDPILLKVFISWLLQEGVSREDIKVRLHLYSDMDIQRETLFWSNILHIPVGHFTKPSIKKSLKSNISYKGRFDHGTCQVIYGDRLMNDRIRAGIEHLRFLFT